MNADEMPVYCKVLSQIKDQQGNEAGVGFWEHDHITNAPVAVHTELDHVDIAAAFFCPQPSGAHKTNCSAVIQCN